MASLFGLEDGVANRCAFSQEGINAVSNSMEKEKSRRQMTCSEDHRNPLNQEVFNFYWIHVFS
jgi:hypothetical protein